jgi:hypothetical protein
VRFSICLTACAGLAFGLAGCGSSNDVWVTCELSRNGRPFTVPDAHSIQVTFYAIEVTDKDGTKKANNEPYAAAPSGEGMFEVPGRDGRGIPPGKYRISVVQKPKTASAAPQPKSKREAADRDFDFLRDRYGPTTSPIVRTVDSKASHLQIDLDNPSG